MVITSTANFRQTRSELIADRMRIETQRVFNEHLIPAFSSPKSGANPTAPLGVALEILYTPDTEFEYLQTSYSRPVILHV